MSNDERQPMYPRQQAATILLARGPVLHINVYLYMHTVN